MREAHGFYGMLARVALPVAVSALAGAIGGFLVDLGGSIGYGFGHGLVALVCAAIYGLAVGEIVTRACRRGTNLGLESMVASGLIIGAVGGRAIVGCQILHSVWRSNLTDGYCAQMIFSVLSPIMLASLAVSIFTAVSRIRLLRRSLA